MHPRIVSKLLRQTSSRRRFLQALGFACLAASALSTARAQTVYTWHGGTGTWETGGLWDPTMAVPDSADADVFIDGGKTGTASVVTMNNSHTVGRLTVDAGDTLNIGNNVDFYLASSFAGSESIINNGTINFNSTGSGIYLHYIGANASLTGTGTVNLLGGNDKIFAQNGGGDRLTIGAGSTIAGTGNLGIGQSTFTNNGLVNANISGQVLALQPGQGSGDFTNGAAGIAQASGGGVLQLVGGGTFTGGTFRALAGSTVNIGNNANVVSTTLTTVGSGAVALTDSASLTNVTNNGTLVANNNTNTYLYGTLINNGTFTLASTGNGDDLHFVGANETLAGTGTIIMNGPNDRIFANNGGGDRLTIAAGASITGTGNLGIGQSTFTNNGTVNANQNGNTLALQPGQGTGDFISGTGGVTEASNGGTLALFGGGTFTGPGGFQALVGSTVTIGSNANVVSTTLSTTGTGTVVLTDTATLNNVTSNGTLNANNNSTTYLYGTLTNNGTFTLASIGNGDDLRFVGASETLNGTGTLVLSGANDRVFASNGGGDRLTIAAGATIAGTGNLGIGQSTFTNNGTVNANVNGASLALQPGQGLGDFTNGATGIAQASNGGVLVLTTGIFSGPGFRALNGSTVNIGGGANLVGATLSTAGSGTAVLTDTATFTNSTTNGTVNAANNSVTFLVGTLTNNGTFNLNSTGSGDDIRFVGNTTLNGTGTINLNGSNDRVFASNGGGDRLTIAAGSTVAGTGNLGVGQSTFTNNGTVNANQSGLTLTLQPGQGSGDFTSVGVTEATNGGNLTMYGGGGFTGTGGFTAGNGSTVTLTNNPNVFATTVSSTGTGSVIIADVASLTNVTLAGTINASNNAVTYLYGTLTNNGTFNLNSTGSGDDIRFVGNTTLNGTGTINLNGSNDRVFASNGGGDRLTIAAGSTVAGTGNLGAAQSTFTNNGTVNANQSGLTLTLQPGQGSGDFTTGATGVTEATGGGVMVQTGGVFTNNGTYAVVSNGTGGGSSLSVDAGHLTNFAGTTLTGGTYNVISTNTSATSTLSFGGGTITTNAANVTLSGASTVFAEIGGLANNQGSFTVANGRNFATAGALASSGRTVAAGGSTLMVNGAFTQSATGTLTGNGTFTASSFSVSGNVNPGGTVSTTTGAFADAAGTTTFNGPATFNVDAQFHFELGSTTGTNDHLNVNGALGLNGVLNVTALAGFGTGLYDLIDYPALQRTGAGLALGTLPAGYTYVISYAIPGQVDLIVTQNVPEPGAWAFVLGGAALLVGVQRARRNAGYGG